MKIIQDMIPSKTKSPLREAIPKEKKEDVQEKLTKKKISRTHKIHRTNRGIVGTRSVKPWHFALIAFICLCSIVYAFSVVYGRATVTITPASIVIPVSGTYTAYENSNASNTLTYQIIQTNAQLYQNVPATIGPLTETPAKGYVILYNNYSSASQKIIAGTRLSNGNGLVYKTNNTILIPGITKGIAGSVAVGITAASGGASYNILPSDLTSNPSYGDFNIIAYKNSPKYTGFYGRLNPNGTGITGGSSGHQITVATSTASAANQTMEQSLQKSLLAKAQSLIPSDYIMFDDAYTVNFTPTISPANSSTSPTATLGMSAVFSGIIFKKTALAQTLAPTQYTSSFDPQFESSKFTIINPQTFSLTNDVTGAPLNFSFNGTMNLVGILSTTTLANQLAGISLGQSTTVFKEYGAISTAHVTMVPFWKHSFPSSPSRITIDITSN